MKFANRIKRVELVNLDESGIEANAKNWRQHPEQQRRALEDVLAKVGKAGVLLAYESARAGGRHVFIDGHLRREVDSGEWWVAFTDLSDDEADTLLATYDPIGAMALADSKALSVLNGDVLPRLGDDGLKGFLEGLASEQPPAPDAPPRDTPPDDASGAESASRDEREARQAERAEEAKRRREEAVAEFGVEAGQIWKVGRHRFACGDSTFDALVDALFDGEQADLVFADPPYNQAEFSKNFAADLRPSSYGELEAAQWDRGFDFAPFAAALERRLADDATVYVCHAQWTAPAVWGWAFGAFDFVSYCVWCKPNPFPSMSKRHWLFATELVTYATKGKHTFNYPDEGHALNWRVHTVEQAGRIHPTQKAVGLVADVLSHSAREGARVYDPCAGSGTTLLVAERLGLRGFAVELSVEYFADALKRFADAGLRCELIHTVGAE